LFWPGAFNFSELNSRDFTESARDDSQTEDFKKGKQFKVTENSRNFDFLNG
jgi:hypothetical protein